MKYFRKHPDLIIIANYQKSSLIKRIIRKLGTSQKVLLLTDAPDDIQHKGFITRTAWTPGLPLSVFRLVNRLIYNHQTLNICILFQPELFGRFLTGLFTPILILALRLTGKRITIMFLTRPRISPYPTVGQTITYYSRYAIQKILRALAHTIS